MGRKRSAWGWHRLDARSARRLVADAHLPTGALVLDIGAGDGVITSALLDAGMCVIAVELHPERVRTLRRRFGGVATVVRADVADLRLPRRPFHAVANPPFGATTPLLNRLTATGSRLVGADLVLQRQATARWLRPDAPGAGRWSRTYHVEAGPSIPRRAFHPAPHVDARVLRIRRR